MQGSRVSFFAVATLALTTSAFAQGLPDRRTFFTFSGDVELPGATLPAGRYLFRLPSPDTSHHVVQVLSADNRKVYGMFFTLPVERSQAPDDPEIRFLETAPGVSPAVKTWWYPGERSGFAFIYPKEQARRLARAAKEPVLTTLAQTTKATETDTRDLVRIAPSGDETRIDESTKSDATALTGAVSRGQRADNSSRVPLTLSARKELPRTASDLPLRFFGGALALLGAIAIGGQRRQEV